MRIVKINAVWCSGCIVMRKIWKKVMETYSDIEVIDYDYDFDEEEVKKYNVGQTLPVAIFYDGDLEVARLNGEKSFEEISNIIQKYS